MSGPPPIPPRPSEPASVPGPPPFPPVVRGTLLADGTAAKSGLLRRGIKWQASGVLERGANLPGQPVAIGDPYTLHLGPERTCVDEKGRQRNEFLSWPPAESGQTHLYTWRYHLAPGLPTAYQFFHLTQLFSRDHGGFLVSLGLVKPAKVKISLAAPLAAAPAATEDDNVLECNADAFSGQTTVHRMSVQWGPNGSIDYSVRTAETDEVLLRYRASHVDVPARGSIKCGLYRAKVVSAASAVVGDFDFACSSSTTGGS
ncbi:hypothetical protein JCM11491_006700 [Sporobolomyces phaffii]